MKLNQKKATDLIKNLRDSWFTNSAIIENNALKLLNLRYLDGDQWIYYDRDRKRIFPLPYDENVIKVTANYILPYSESVKSRILSFNPRPRIISMTKDWSDWTKALQYTKLFKGVLSAINFDDYLQDIVDIQMVCGGAWVRPFWNKDIDNGRFKGEIDLDIRHDITAIIDPLATKTKAVRYVMFIDLWSKEEINDRFKAGFKKADDLTKELSGWFLTVYKELRSFKLTNQDRSIIEVNDGILVYSLFFTDEKGQVKIAFFAKDKFLGFEDIDFMPTYIPYYKNAFSSTGRTPLNSLRPMNLHINETLTRIKAETNKTVKMVIDQDVEISEDVTTFDMDSSEIVRVQTQKPNALMKFINPPVGATIDVSLWNSVFSEVGGLSESARGKVPTSQASAKLVDRLVDQDETKIGNAKANNRIGLKKVFKQFTTLFNKNYGEERVYAVAGRQRGWESVAFFINKEDNLWYELDVEIGSALPTTAGSKIGTVTQLLQMGVFNDLPNPQEHARQLMDLNVFELDEVSQSVDKQNMEIEAILKNAEAPAVQDFDEHMIHIQVILEFMNTLDFEKMTEKQKRLIFVHRDSHLQAIKQMMRSQANTGNTPTSKPEAQPTVPQQTL